jgi:hypothetical protein
MSFNKYIPSFCLARNVVLLEMPNVDLRASFIQQFLMPVAAFFLKTKNLASLDLLSSSFGVQHHVERRL